ncbi:MAG: hypothetical protein QM680_11070 [Luteolibacter sp.]
MKHPRATAALLLCLLGFGYAWIRLQHLPASDASEAKEKRTVSPRHSPVRDVSQLPEKNLRERIEHSPESLIHEALELLKKDPSDPEGNYAKLLLRLCRASHFEIARRLIETPPFEEHPDWTTILFQAWASQHPLEAMEAADTFSDPAQKSAAFRSAAEGWNSTDRAALAAYVVKLPQNEDSDYALNLAFQSWSLQDPESLSRWIDTLPAGPEYDAAAYIMLGKSDLATSPPEISIQRAETIGDPDLKMDSYRHIIRNWAASDPAAARHHLDHAAWLDEKQRQELRDELGCN